MNGEHLAITNCAEIARTISYFKTPTQVVELRARSTKSGIIRGLFNDGKILAKYAIKLSGMADVESINMTMHALDGALEADNIAYRHSRRACTTENVTHLRYFMIDLDRDSGDRPATQAEIEDCLDTMRAISGYLLAKGWPEPAIAVSGNGVHGYYLIEYMCRDQIIVGIFNDCLRALAARFNTEGIQHRPGHRTAYHHAPHLRCHKSEVRWGWDGIFLGLSADWTTCSYTPATMRVGRHSARREALNLSDSRQ
jgi:hypothetical protein